MQLVIAKCSVDYAGRLSAHLPLATRVLMLKQDGSLLIHSDGGSYKPLNWMSPPCILDKLEPDELQVEAGVTQVWRVQHTKTAEQAKFETVGDLDIALHVPNLSAHSGLAYGFLMVSFSTLRRRSM